jgi:hypothetical protein
MEAHSIRLVRERSNRALAERDLSGLSHCWAPDYVVVTSANVHGVGRQASVDRLCSTFLTKPDLRMVREPLDIEVLAEWGMAAERGRWESSWSAADGNFGMSGTYFAKWQKYVDAGWLIQGELYVTLSFTGPTAWERPLPVAVR